MAVSPSRTIFLVLSVCLIAALAVLAIDWGFRTVPDENLIRIDRVNFKPSDGLPTSQLNRELDKPGEYSVSLPHDWRIDKGIDEAATARQAWYSFDLPLVVAPDRLWGIWLPKVSMNASVYVNSELVGQIGQMVPRVSRNQNQSLYFLLANGTLQPGQNSFSIKVADQRAGQGFMSEVYLGPDRELSEYVWRHQFGVHTLKQLTVATMLVMAVFMTFLCIHQTGVSIYGWFGALLYAWAGHDMPMLILTPVLPEIVFDWFWHASLLAFVYFVNQFSSRYFDIIEPTYERRLAAYVIATFPVLGAIAAYSPEFFYAHAILVSDTVALLLALNPFLISAKTQFKGVSLPSVAVMGGGGLAMFLGLHDWLTITAILDVRAGYLLPYGAPYIMMVFGFILVRRFGHSIVNLADLNKTLEARVQQSQETISANYQRLMVLEREQVVSDERSRLMRDMHDGVGSSLISTLAMVEANQCSSEQVAGELRHSIDDLRLLLDSMDPTDGDLLTVLGMFRYRMEPRLNACGIKFDWAVRDMPFLNDVGPKKALQVLRIVQEAINNVIKHANASTIRLETGSIEATDTTPAVSYVTITDNGCGFEHGGFGLGESTAGALAQATIERAQAPATGRGLRNMQARAAEIDALLEIQSMPSGTCLSLTFNHR